jgi:hypothetical protein
MRSFDGKLAEAVSGDKLSADGSPMKVLAAAKTMTPVAKPVAAKAYTSARATSKSSTRSATVTKASTASKLSQAKSILASYISKYPILKGTTVEFGDAKGYQAIAYYKSGRIVISPTHRSSLSAIIGHEIWHIIDWRDNGKIDWGEKVPPK